MQKAYSHNDENLTIAYEDDSFSHNSQGYAPTLKLNWIKHHLEKIHNAKVLMINEFNTSQVCSKCHCAKLLVELKGKYDPKKDDIKKSPVKPHFVRRHANCLAIWNRDTNACRNMIYLAREEIIGQGDLGYLVIICHLIRKVFVEATRYSWNRAEMPLVLLVFIFTP